MLVVNLACVRGRNEMYANSTVKRPRQAKNEQRPPALPWLFLTLLFFFFNGWLGRKSLVEIIIIQKYHYYWLSPF